MSDASAAPAAVRFGEGPIEALFQQVVDGALTMRKAVEMAAAPSVGRQLTPAYASDVRRYALSVSQAGDSQTGLAILDLLRAAAVALPPSAESMSIVGPAIVDWIELVHRILPEVADGRLYRRAIAVGEGLLGALDKGAKAGRGLVLHKLGTLNLDPYAARSSVNYAQDLQRWRRSFYEENAAELAGVPETEWTMPEPQVALSRAEDYLQRAAELREGNDKGLSLKALAQAVLWQAIAGGKPLDKARLASVCASALAALDPAKEPMHYLSVIGMAAQAGVKPDPTSVDRALAVSLDEQLRRDGPRQVADLVHAAVTVLEEDYPERALLLFDQSRVLFESFAPEALRRTMWQRELVLVARAWGGPGFAAKPAAFADEANRIAQGEEDVLRRAARLVSLATRAPNWNEELTALDVVGAVRAMAPIFAKTYEGALGMLEAELWLGAAVNAYSSQTWDEAIRLYGRACGAYLEVKLSALAVECLERIDDVATHATGLTEPVLEALAHSAGALEGAAGGAATRVIQRLCRAATANAGNPVPIASLFLVWQIAKGLRFGSAILSGGAHLRREDERGERLLREIEAIPAQPPVTSQDPDERAEYLEEIFLAADVGEGERAGGDSPADRRRNLQRAYDDHLVSRLLREPAGLATFMTIEDVQRSLDRRTVLAYVFLGNDDKGSVAVYNLLVSNEQMSLVRVGHGFPSGTVRMGDGARVANLDPVAVPVSAVRRAIQEPSGWPVSDEAAELLATGVAAYFGDAQQLEVFRKAGKDHLCVVPHRALHYYPFHLAGPSDAPLAKDWIVTYLPNLQLLSTVRGRPSARAYRPHALTALGLGYEKTNPFGLPIIQGAIDEVRDIAGVFGAQPLVDAQVTETAVVEALRTSRYVHMAMHGQHDINAPSFQCLFMTPDATSDGRLCAHEVLGLDLRGLELLTLSACETALGRFDSSDNLRGLPAAFLIAGVSTLVGTMWEVDSDASRAFFVAFYKEIASGKSRLDAFGAAQRQTRESFPRHEHWGAFYMAGDWS